MANIRLKAALLAGAFMLAAPLAAGDVFAQAKKPALGQPGRLSDDGSAQPE